MSFIRIINLRIKKSICFLILSLSISLSSFCQTSSSESGSTEIKSPDGNLKMVFNSQKVIDGKSRMTFLIDYKNNPVVKESELGIQSWKENIIVKNVTSSTHDTTWKPVYGEKSIYRDNYNQCIIRLTKDISARDELQLIIRVYNEGVAFRYFFPEHSNGGSYVHIDNENTQFSFPDETKAWFTPKAQAEYKCLPLSNWPEEGERPLTLVLKNGLFACIGEAEMVNYSRTKFIVKPEKENTVFCSMYDCVDEITPFATPWRYVMVAEKPGQLLENNYLILNLNPPCKIENTSWIKPGKVIREITLSTQGGKDCIDFASAHNLQYIEFDAGWYGYEYIAGSDATQVNVDPRRNKNRDLNLQEVINYGKEKNIGVLLYVNQRALSRQLDDILPLYKSWGIKGVKYGFVQVGSHRWTTWMHDAVKKAADNQLMVDIHDEYRPTGFSRTYPNLLTQEGIRGNEEMPDAINNTTLPFTRFVAGAGDYTICYYKQDFAGNAKDGSVNGIPKAKVIKTTSAHQLALAAVYYSPFQFLFWYDRPSDYQNEPEIEFLEKLPTVWDDTKVIQGEIGQYITVARQSGDDWFVGTITNTDARNLSISLNFLPKGKKFIARIYSDDPLAKTRTKVKIEQIKVDASKTLDVKLLPSGGQAIWLKNID